MPADTLIGRTSCVVTYRWQNSLQYPFKSVLKSTIIVLSHQFVYDSGVYMTVNCLWHLMIFWHTQIFTYIIDWIWRTYFLADCVLCKFTLPALITFWTCPKYTASVVTLYNHIVWSEGRSSTDLIYQRCMLKIIYRLSRLVCSCWIWIEHQSLSIFFPPPSPTEMFLSTKLKAAC